MSATDRRVRSRSASPGDRTGAMTRPARGAATETKRDVARMAENMAMVADQRKQVGGWQGHVWLAKSRAVRPRVNKTKQTILSFYFTTHRGQSGSSPVQCTSANPPLTSKPPRTRARALPMNNLNRRFSFSHSQPRNHEAQEPRKRC